MPYLDLASLPDEPDQFVRRQIYNALDCAVTHEVAHVLGPQVRADPKAWRTYGFTMTMMGPALTLMLRGIKMDMLLLADLIEETEKEQAYHRKIFDTYCEAWGEKINPGSPAQLKRLFYEVMEVPSFTVYTGGSRKVSTGKEALDHMWTHYRIARPMITQLRAIRDCAKRLLVLRSGIESDGRLRASFSPTGTESGRWSSRKNIFNRGTNLQNITGRMRRPFIADSGKKLYYIDLEQAESRAVAYLSGDEAYIEACESDDLHTTVCRMVWPELDWAEDRTQWKSYCDNLPFPGDPTKTYRDIAKRLGHGTNYEGTPRTLARLTGTPELAVRQFQVKYFGAFPGIAKWQRHTKMAIYAGNPLTTPWGRTRLFLGRRDDPATCREAIAYRPQSLIGDLLNVAFYRVWAKHDPANLECLNQVHDAILFQCPEYETATAKAAFDLMQFHIPVTDINGKTRQMLVPCGAEAGYSWYKDPTKKDPKAMKGISFA